MLFITFIFNFHIFSCWADLGKIGGKQDLNIGPRCNDKGCYIIYFYELVYIC